MKTVSILILFLFAYLNFNCVLDNAIGRKDFIKGSEVRSLIQEKATEAILLLAILSPGSFSNPPPILLGLGKLIPIDDNAYYNKNNTETCVKLLVQTARISGPTVLLLPPCTLKPVSKY